MDKNALKKEIMREFARQRMKANHSIPLRFWWHTFIPRLNPKEEMLFGEAVNELIDEGMLIYIKSPIESLVLTEIGFDRIYD